MMIVPVLGISCWTAPAFGFTPFEPTAADIQKAEESAQLTDPEAAGELPHRDLDRDEAIELLESVFGPIVEAPAGIFDDLRVQKFLSDNVAVIAPGEQPDVPGVSAPDEQVDQGPTLLESSIPLRAEDSPGNEEVVDLDLELSAGELRPANALVEVGIPLELGEGIELPEAGVQIELDGAPEDRAASLMDESVAFYPNVAKDTDLAISPTPDGVETFTQLRSPDAPRSQIFDLNLPQDAVLVETAGGGAEASLDGEPLLRILQPTAVDANGDPVPAELEVNGTALTVKVTPGESTRFPVMLDPIFDTYDWDKGQGYTGWTPYKTPVSSIWNTFTTPVHGCSTYCYLQVNASPAGWTHTNAQAYWNYTVPRWQEDYEAVGSRPTSWVQTFTVGSMVFSGNGDYQPSPNLLFAVSDGSAAWQSANLYPPNATGAYGVDLASNHSGKMASFGMFATSNSYLNAYRYVLAGYAQVGLGDGDTPGFGSIAGPTKWVHNQPEMFNVTVSDSGLGVASLKVHRQGSLLGTTQIKAGAGNCVGTASAPCPRTWRGAQDGNLVNYDPSGLGQGTQLLTLTAADPLGNSKTASFPVKVDHTSPAVSLAGSLTEQGTLGTSRPKYDLKVTAVDGSSASPQSGTTATLIKVDGKVVDSFSPGCATQNCTIERTWSLDSSLYSGGAHEVEVTATDAVGLVSIKKLQIEIQNDAVDPTLSTAGALINSPGDWLEQQSYSMSITSKDSGYGVTALALKIDGVTVASQTKGCASGGCSLMLIPSVNMAKYSGGAHAAEAIATDGAGNSTEHAWTINVNPAGEVPAAEAVDTLEAVDASTGSSIVASTTDAIDAAEIEAGNNPSVVNEGGSLISQGVATPATISTDPGKGFTLEAPATEIHVEPVSVDSTATPVVEANDASGVAANTSGNVDSIVRPVYDGVTTFETIRDENAPSTYSWEVELGEGQSLSSIDELNAEVLYEDGSQAMTITAGPAHDATGAGVPVSLSVSEGNMITLTVAHKSSSFVYPVTAGPSWQTGYPIVIVGPVIKNPGTEEEEKIIAIAESSEIVGQAGPPVIVPGDTDPETGATASAARPVYQRKFDFAECAWSGFAGCVPWEARIVGWFHYNKRYTWWKGERTHPNCPHHGNGYSVTIFQCEFVGPNHQKYGKGYHITARLLWDLGASVGIGSFTWDQHLSVYMYGSGGAYAHDTACICNPWNG